MMHAVTGGNKDVVAYLLKKKVDVNAVDHSVKSALHHVSKRVRQRRGAEFDADQTDIVKLLLQARAQLEARDGNGCTPLMFAVANGDEAVARYLLESKANVLISDSEGHTSLDYAQDFELKGLVEILERAKERQEKEGPGSPTHGVSMITRQTGCVAADGGCPTAQPPVRRKGQPAASSEGDSSDDAEVEVFGAVTTGKTIGGACVAAGSAVASSTTAAAVCQESSPSASPAAASDTTEPRKAWADPVEDDEEARKKEKKEKKRSKKEKEAAEQLETSPEVVEAGDGAKKERRRSDKDEIAPGTAAEDEAAREAAAKAVAEEEQRKAEEKERRKKEKEEEKRRASEEAQKAAEEAQKAAEEAKQQLKDKLRALVAGSAAASIEKAMSDLKAAVKEAQEACIEGPELEEAEARLKELKKVGKAVEKLEQAVAERDVRGLQKAIAKAEEAAVPAEAVQAARQALAEELPKQEAREKLEALRQGATAEQLKEALANAKSAGLKKDELAEFKQLLATLELRDEAEAALKQAMVDRSVDGLRIAIAKAEELGVDAKQIKKANKVLKEEEPKQKAREQLAQACNKPSIEVLEEAIKVAKEVGLEANEYSAAEEKLHLEREKERLMAAVKETLAASMTVDLSDIDALREMKDKLGDAIKTAAEAGVSEVHMVEADQRRKRIHNAIEDLKGSIRVFCRIRPLSSKERETGDTQVTQSSGSMTLNVDGKDGDDKTSFAFDAVFTPGTQEQIFEDCSDLVQSAVDGYNVTVFAYGQTGAGKTFTMYGAKGNEGIAPKTIQELYKILERNSNRFDFNIYASMLELYRNDLVDLLNKDVQGTKSKLNIKTDKANRIFVENLVEEECRTAAELAELMDRGMKQRTVAATAMNSESSRSHLVLMVRILSTNKESGEELRGKILICDLAGSERLKKSLVTEEQKQEAIEINKSLTALGDVIESLTKKQKSVPYRNHKLTQLMQDSLGGSAKTLMFVNCSPASSNLDETLMSLKYATRAKKITNATKKG